jgi:anti-sigma B factor antagonist
MRLSATRIGDVTIVAAVGEIDIASSGQLRDCLDDVVDRGERHIVLDLSQVRFVDSTFLGVLVGIRNRLHPVGGRVAVVCPHAPVVKIFRITGLDQVFPLHSALEDVVHPPTQHAAEDGSR